MTGALTMLAGLPHLHPLFCAAADPGWIAALETAHASGQPAPPEPPMQLAPAAAPPDAMARLAGYGAEALRRLTSWCGWHCDRGEARGVPAVAPFKGLAALYSLYERIDDLGAAFDGGDDAAISLASLAVHAAIAEAKSAASDDGARTGLRGTAAHDQCAEVDQGPMLSILRGFDAIEALRRAVRDGDMDGPEAVGHAADLFAFGFLAGAEAEAG